MRILVNSWTFLGSALVVNVLVADGRADDGALRLELEATVPIARGLDPTDYRDLLAQLGALVLELAEHAETATTPG